MKNVLWAILVALAMVACGSDPSVTGMQLPSEVAALPAPKDGKLKVEEATLSSSWCSSNSKCSDDLDNWLYNHDVDSWCVTGEYAWCSSGTCKGSMTIDFLCSESEYGCTSDAQCGSGYRCLAGTCSYYGNWYGGSCDDGDACTYNDTYTSSWSCSGTRYTCSDGNACTSDECYVSGGTPYCRNSSTSCQDNDACTTDWCSSGGTCQHTRTSGCCTSSSQCGSGYVCSYNQCVWSGYNSGGNSGVVGTVYAEIVTAPSFNASWADFYGQFCSWGGMSNYATPTCSQSGFNRSWGYMNSTAWVSENNWNRKVLKVQLTVPEGARTNEGFLIGSLVVSGNRNVWYPEKASGANDVTVRFLDYAGRELQQYIYNSNNGGYLVKVKLQH